MELSPKVVILLNMVNTIATILLVLGAFLLFGSNSWIGGGMVSTGLGLLIYKPTEENMTAWLFLFAIIGIVLGFIFGGAGMEPAVAPLG